MKHRKLYVVNENGIALCIVKLEGEGVSIVSVVTPLSLLLANYSAILVHVQPGSLPAPGLLIRIIRPPFLNDIL